MKKVYMHVLSLSLGVLSVAAVSAQNTFTGATNTRWNVATNWSLGRVPASGDEIIIPASKNAVINGSTVALGNVTIKIKPAGILTIGAGSGSGANAGKLELDENSIISIESDLASSRGKLQADNANNASNIVTIGGVTKFQGNTTYTINNSGLGFVNGPAMASAATGSGANGFTFGALPIVLSRFDASLTASGAVSISWTAEVSGSASRFAVEKSFNGISWTSIAAVNATSAGKASNYTAADASPSTGSNLYRLKMIDVDGQVTYSAVRTIRISGQGKISVFPNPAVNVINVSLSQAPAAEWTVKISNAFGQAVSQKKISKDNSSISIPVTQLASGVYNVEVNAGGKVESSRILINKQ